MRVLKFLIVAILFVLLGAVEHAQAQDASNKISAEDARTERALARCKMESMKYNLMDSNQLNRRMFYLACMKAEGYAYDSTRPGPQ